jgi:hypothetical protein
VAGTTVFTRWKPLNQYLRTREGTCKTIAKKIRVVRKVANKLQAVKDKVKRAEANKDKRAKKAVAKAGKRAISRAAN